MHKVTMTPNKKDLSICVIFNLLYSRKCSFTLDFDLKKNKVTFVSEVPDDIIEGLKRHAKVEIEPNLDELETKVFEILNSVEDNTLELNYPVHIIREGCIGEYSDDIHWVSLIDEDTIMCGKDNPDEYYALDLIPEELTNLYKEIIDTNDYNNSNN